MSFTQVGELRYFKFKNFEFPTLIQGIFTRDGGVSPTPWKSLNLGGLSGDTRENVIENRRRVFEAIGLEVASIYDAWQVHGTHVVCATRPRPFDLPHIKADAILTDKPGVTLFMRFADCVPIFLYDKIRHVIGIVHAGWQGTVLQIARIAVEKMISEYGSDPIDILAGIGPSIGPDHYEIGLEVTEKVRDCLPGNVGQLIEERAGKMFLNLWKANQNQLEQTGIEDIEIAGLCTACDTSNWYSHRAEKGKTGRFGALLAIKG